MGIGVTVRHQLGVVLSDLEKVRRYLRENHDAYVGFLDLVKSGCRAVQAELGSQVVLRVYDRRDKQGGEALKDAVKVQDACQNPIGRQRLAKVTDIIGVTMVVQYPDQIDLALDRLRDLLGSGKATETKRKKHSETYFATHSTYRLDDVANLGLHCEVQCKTILHDGWSAKMHDLTYKPTGTMDGRMKGLIEAISVTLEGLEQQSQIAREIIVGRQKGELKPFQTSLAIFLQSVEGTMRTEGNADPVAQLREEVREFASDGASRSGTRAAELGTALREAIEAPESAAAAWLVAVRFASALGGSEAIRFLDSKGETIFDELADLVSRKLINEAQIRALPIGFYALQDFGRAIEYVDRLIDARDELSLSEDCQLILRFNKATWLLERESVKPSKPEKSMRVRQEIEELMTEVRPALQMKDEAVVTDTDGLFLIVYGETKEDVRKGIDMCIEAGAPVEGDELETAVALAYAEWRNHVGWRRYFELAEREGLGD